jgi:type IV pilus assembly protein PilM
MRRKRRPVLGIDIGSTAIRLIELLPAERDEQALYRVAAFAALSAPANAVVEKRFADVEAIGHAIRRAVRQSGSKVKRAAVAVSGSAVITKVVSMSQALSETEMGAQIELEADQYVPYPLEEVNLDYDILGPSPGRSDSIDVLLAASRRENVDDRVAALEIAGLKAEVVDVEAYAIEGACSLLLGSLTEAKHERTVAVIDLGAAETRLHVVHGAQVVYSREQSFGGNQLLEELQRRYGIDRETALGRLDADDLPPEFNDDVRAPYMEALAQQIARSLQFFYSATQFNSVDQVILSGGCAKLPGIEGVVAERLGLPAEIANPFASMSIAPQLDAERLRRDGPAMMVAVGLALRGFT